MTQGEPAPSDPVVAFELDAPEIPFRRLIDAASTFLGLIQEVATDVAGPGIGWVLEDLRRMSPAQVAVRPVAREKDIPLPRLAEVTRAISEGVNALQVSAVRPPHFSDRALQKAKEFAGYAGLGMQGVRVRRGTRSVAVTSQLIANVDAILGQTVASIGTVEGRLEGVNVHGRRYFTVYEALTGERVECQFGHRISTQEIGRAIEKRVAVHGQIEYRDNGEIVRVTASELEVFPPESDLPSPDDVRGILEA